MDLEKSTRQPYVRPVDSTWWTKKGFYTAYMLREGTCLLVLAFVSGEASVARLAGDTVHLPMLYPALLALAYVLCMVVVLTVCVTCNFCRCLLWGALKAKAEREAAAAAVAEANVL